MSVDYRLRFNFSIFPFLITILIAKWPDFVRGGEQIVFMGGFAPWLRDGYGPAQDH